MFCKKIPFSGMVVVKNARNIFICYSVNIRQFTHIQFFRTNTV